MVQNVVKGWVVVILGLAACGCFRSPAPSLAELPEQPENYDSAPANVVADVRRYKVDKGWLLVKVYRAGRLARLGHNHLIEAPIRGQFSVSNGQADADLFVRPADLLVDQAATRAQAGPDFAKVIKPDDIEGTQGNLLSEKVLNPLVHPFIRARFNSRAPSDVPSHDSNKVTVTFELAGYSLEQDLAIEVVSDDRCRPVYRGDATLSHSDFGMPRFSILGGAVAVADEFSISFEITGQLLDQGCEVSETISSVSVPARMRVNALNHLRLPA